MTTDYDFSPTELRTRRHRLKQERRVRTLKVFWQVWLLSGITGGIIWGVTRPDWTIRKAQQIKISGNQALTEKTIREMLGVKYPAPLLAIEPQTLHTKLLTNGSITAATVHRELLPPSLHIQVRDRFPVATVDRLINNKSVRGLLDETGQWLPISSYRLTANQIPQLRLLANDTCPGWADLYKAVQQSPVAVTEINCQDILNLTLTTEIGSIRIGEFDRTRIYKQLQKAHELRNWQQSTTIKNAIINLENPQAPKLQEIGGKALTPPTPETKP
jgi:cell division protein FtsQ